VRVKINVSGPSKSDETLNCDEDPAGQPAAGGQESVPSGDPHARAAPALQLLMVPPAGEATVRLNTAPCGRADARLSVQLRTLGSVNTLEQAAVGADAPEKEARLVSTKVEPTLPG
jgi:hypothetical protein